MTYQMKIDEEREEAREQGRMEGEAKGRMEGEAKGRMEGILAMIATLKDISFTQSQVAEQLMKRFSLSETEALATVQANW